jgi:hypothetical protein
MSIARPECDLPTANALNALIERRSTGKVVVILQTDGKPQ